MEDFPCPSIEVDLVDNLKNTMWSSIEEDLPRGLLSNKHDLVVFYQRRLTSLSFLKERYASGLLWTETSRNPPGILSKKSLCYSIDEDLVIF